MIYNVISLALLCFGFSFPVFAANESPQSPPQQNGNVAPPAMPIPPQPQQPAPGAGQPQPAPGQPQPAPQQMQPPPQESQTAGTTAPTTSAKLPDDFELIAINPYFKNKPRLGRLTTTLQSNTGEVLGTIANDFGDCKACIRGASIKGKIGVRIYGRDLRSLTVSRKNSSSIKLVNCANEVPLQNNSYTCEFSSAGTTMKMVLKVEP